MGIDCEQNVSIGDPESNLDLDIGECITYPGVKIANRGSHLLWIMNGIEKLGLSYEQWMHEWSFLR